MNLTRNELRSVSVNRVLTNLKMIRAVTLVMAFLLSSLYSISVFADQAPTQDQRSDNEQKSHKVYFSLADEFGGPKKESLDQFDCSDQIFTVAELSNYEKGEYELTVLWKDPIETVREKTRYEFTVHGPETRIWAWLTLSRAMGAGLIQWIDPAAGLESFIGDWTIDVLINGKRISKQTFEVSC